MNSHLLNVSVIIKSSSIDNMLYSFRLLNIYICLIKLFLFITVESIDPSYQPDAQNRRCALHAAAQRGLLEICYMLVQVRNCKNVRQCYFHFTLTYVKYVRNNFERKDPLQ